MLLVQLVLGLLVLYKSVQTILPLDCQLAASVAGVTAAGYDKSFVVVLLHLFQLMNLHK
jgi:hypothetical protein